MSVRKGSAEYGPVVVAMVQLPEDQPKGESDMRLDLSSLRAPRVMREMTGLGRLGTGQHRRAVKRLRKTWYRKPCRSSPTGECEFIRQALALAAALLEREAIQRLPSRLQRQANVLAAQDPTAVASWQRWLRISEARRGTMDAGVDPGETGHV